MSERPSKWAGRLIFFVLDLLRDLLLELLRELLQELLLNLYFFVYPYARVSSDFKNSGAGTRV